MGNVILPKLGATECSLVHDGVTATRTSDAAIRMDIGDGGVYVLFSFAISGRATSALYRCPQYGVLELIGGAPPSGLQWYFEEWQGKWLIVYIGSSEAAIYSGNYCATKLKMKY